MTSPKKRLLATFTTEYDTYSIVKEWYNGRPARLLLSSGKVPQSGVAVDGEPEQLFDYCKRLAELAIGVRPEKSLFLGGGAFTLPTFAARFLGSHVTAVEIDSFLVESVKEHFDIAGEDEGLSIVIDDAAHYITYNPSKYDLIVVDVFKDREIPEALINPAAILAYKKMITNPEGVVAFNCISRYHTISPAVVRVLVIHLKEAFSYVQVFPADVHQDKRSSQNLIVVASDADLDTPCQYMQSYPVTVLGIES